MLSIDADDRQRLTRELLGEMSAWHPKERIGAFRAWLRGSLSLIHLHVLTVLEADGPLSMRRLADALDVSVASATGIVDRMADRGLVERRPHASDRRVVLVHATAAGNAVFHDLETGRRAHLEGLLERLTDDELVSVLAGACAMRRVREEIAAETAAAASTADAATPADGHGPGRP